MVVLPATAALLVLAGPLTVAIFHYGRFDENDVRMSSLALMAYSSGLLGFSLVKVLAPGFFARQDTRTPVRIGIQSLGVNIGLNLAIVLPLALTHDRPGLHALLALNNGIGAWYNSSMLYRGLRRQGVLKPSPGWRRLLVQIASATVLMCAFLWWLAGDTARWIEMGAWQRVQWMSLLVAGGGGHLLRYALAAWPAARGSARAQPGRLRKGREMELVRGLHNLRPRHHGCVATIGNYDGVHRGHQHMLAALRRRALELGLPATVVTFEPTPREYFEGAEAPARLTRLREKLQALARYDVDRVVCLYFNAELAAISARSFEEDLLTARLGVRHMVVGHDFHYSRRREGTTASLRAAGRRLGFTVEEVPPFEIEGVRVSSSLVRAALEAGDLAVATRLLGRPYRISGRVQLGQRLGRKLGFPTANLALHRKVIPLWGIFAVRVDGPGFTSLPAVASLGTRPTLDGTVPLLEVHLFDFDRDLYGRNLDVDFIARLRDEVRFDSLEALVEQMHRDAAQARASL